MPTVSLNKKRRSKNDVGNRCATVASRRMYSNAHASQERELQLTNGALNDLQAEADRHQKKARELEDRIQNDDRAEKLEGVLKDTQDRAEELEFQLSKLNQVNFIPSLLNFSTFFYINLGSHTYKN